MVAARRLCSKAEHRLAYLTQATGMGRPGAWHDHQSAYVNSRLPGLVPVTHYPAGRSEGTAERTLKYPGALIDRRLLTTLFLYFDQRVSDLFYRLTITLLHCSTRTRRLHIATRTILLPFCTQTSTRKHTYKQL